MHTTNFEKDGYWWKIVHTYDTLNNEYCNAAKQKKLNDKLKLFTAQIYLWQLLKMNPDTDDNIESNWQFASAEHDNQITTENHNLHPGWEGGNPSFQKWSDSQLQTKSWQWLLAPKKAKVQQDREHQLSVYQAKLHIWISGAFPTTIQSQFCLKRSLGSWVNEMLLFQLDKLGPSITCLCETLLNGVMRLVGIIYSKDKKTNVVFLFTEYNKKKLKD